MGRTETKPILKQSKLEFTVESATRQEKEPQEKKTTISTTNVENRIEKTSQTGDKKTLTKLKPPTNNDNPKIKKSRQKRKCIEREPPGKVRKIDEMFNRIKKNAAQPQSVGIVSEEITKPRDPGFEDYSKVKGLSCTTDGASNCIPDSADP